GLVVATGFTLEPDRPDGPGRRYQVNRPMEGVPGRPAAQEVSSDGARRVYEAYEQRVRAVAQGPLAFYVEIHGNNRREAAQRIEIATVGTDRKSTRLNSSHVSISYAVFCLKKKKKKKQIVECVHTSESY